MSITRPFTLSSYDAAFELLGVMRLLCIHWITISKGKANLHCPWTWNI